MSSFLDPLAWVYVVIAYLFGGVSFTYFMGKWVHDIDLRQHGSGNLGATNALRILGKGWGFLCLFLDTSKGILPAFFAYLRWGDTNNPVVIAVGMATILGHVFTPYLKGGGGKGVATSLGVLIILSPFPVLISVFLFLIVVLITGYVALGSMLSAVFVPVSYFIFFGYCGREYLFFTLVFVAVLIVFNHHSNIKNIINKKEKKIFQYWTKKA